tara:strand:- start:153 stop:392 length:240 start_codon:yes stop_codon:yes gene_type:complete
LFSPFLIVLEINNLICTKMGVMPNPHSRQGLRFEVVHALTNSPKKFFSFLFFYFKTFIIFAAVTLSPLGNQKRGKTSDW